MEESDYFLKRLGIYFLVFIFILSILEVGFLIFAYFNADKVECNFLWCTFTSGDIVEIKDSFSSVTSSITSTSQCFINNLEVNCSEIDYSKFSKYLS